MNEITKNLFCVQMRSGVKIWIEEEKTVKLQAILSGLTGTKFIAFEGQMINSADIVGVFSAKTMSDLAHEKNGEWKCKQGEWHEKFKGCDCNMFRKDENGTVIEEFSPGIGWIKKLDR